ncbi:MAG: hypothetical protein ISS70_23105 [Phycisphaerae bacterium]|nr:hypothetical protein [Phycisphaerae bacterium]
MSFFKFVDYSDSWLSSEILAFAMQASDHYKAAMEINSTPIIAFDAAKCEHGLYAHKMQQPADRQGAPWDDFSLES